MDKGLQNSVITVCNLLNKHEVEYLIVGGTAVALYGYFRMSLTDTGKSAEKPDLDLWYNPTYKNYFNLLDAIAALGEDVSAFKNEKSPNPEKSFFKLNLDKFTIDFLPQLPGLARFRESYRKKEVIEVSGINIPLIDLDDLIANKQALLREKDIADIEELKKRHKK